MSNDESAELPQEQKSKFTPLQRTILSVCEQKFWESGDVPTLALVGKLLGIPEEVVKANWTKDMDAALESRGYDPMPVTSLLTPKQLEVANKVLNTHDKASLRQKLKDSGVSAQQYSAWLRQPAFHDYLAGRAQYGLKASLITADIKLSELVEGGDLASIKFLNELTGRYNPRIQVDVNVNQVLTQVIEILSRHVPQEILAKIADEIDAVMSGRPVLPAAQVIDVLELAEKGTFI